MIVDAERLFCRALSSELRVLVENKVLLVLKGSKLRVLKKSFLRVWLLAEEGSKESVLGCFFELSIVRIDNLL